MGHSKQRRPGGFTLIEISVAIFLAALLMGMSIPAIRSVTAAQLRRSAGMLAGMSREAYARAAISGKPHRLVMNLDDQTFHLEQASGYFVLASEKRKQLTEDELAAAKAPKEARSSRDDDEEDRLRAQLAAGPQWSPVEDELGAPQKMPSDCGFDRVWVSHQSEAFVRGESHVHFWPSGRAETAIIRLTDDLEGSTRIITIKINGLTGRSMVVDRALEIPTS
jgi:prepilin-type N-terminal cleavage/methylation domain-containing protein